MSIYYLFSSNTIVSERRFFMPHLKCYENGCHSNYCAHCVLDSIKVGLDAYCHSYRPKEEKTKDDARCEYEFARDMGYAANMDSHPIQCDNTRCKYQESGMCHHNHVRIDAKAQGPLCVSFDPRYNEDR